MCPPSYRGRRGTGESVHDPPGLHEQAPEVAVAGLGDPVVCRNSADQSRRFSIVEIEQSSEPRPASNVSSHKGRRRGSLEQLVATPLMIPLSMVVLDILVDEASEMAFTQRDHATETLVFDRPDKPLRIGIEIGTPCGETDRVDSTASENLLKESRVQRIAVVNQMV